MRNKDNYMMDSLRKRAEYWVKMSPKQAQETVVVESLKGRMKIKKVYKLMIFNRSVKYVPTLFMLAMSPALLWRLEIE